MASNRLISRLQLVARLRVSKSQLYRDCEAGGKLHNALVGSKVNLDHKNARLYCAEHDYAEPCAKKIKAAALKEVASKPQYTAPPVDIIAPDDYDEEDEDAVQYMDLTLREIVKRYGKQSQFKELVSAYKILVGTQAAEERMARERKEFAHFSHIERLAMHIDGLHKMLLTDAAKNIADTSKTLTAAGASDVDVRKAVTEVLEQVITLAKNQSDRILRNAKR